MSVCFCDQAPLRPASSTPSAASTSSSPIRSPDEAQAQAERRNLDGRGGPVEDRPSTSPSPCCSSAATAASGATRCSRSCACSPGTSRASSSARSPSSTPATSRASPRCTSSRAARSTRSTSTCATPRGSACRPRASSRRASRSPSRPRSSRTDLIQKYPKGLFVAGQLIFDEDTFATRILHNETAFMIQRRLQHAGRPDGRLPGAPQPQGRAAPRGAQPDRRAGRVVACAFPVYSRDRGESLPVWPLSRCGSLAARLLWPRAPSRRPKRRATSRGWSTTARPPPSRPSAAWPTSNPAAAAALDAPLDVRRRRRSARPGSAVVARRPVGAGDAARRARRSEARRPRGDRHGQARPAPRAVSRRPREALVRLSATPQQLQRVEHAREHGPAGARGRRATPVGRVDTRRHVHGDRVAPGATTTRARR